jgi:hypothetical protein
MTWQQLPEMRLRFLFAVWMIAKCSRQRVSGPPGDAERIYRPGTPGRRFQQSSVVLPDNGGRPSPPMASVTKPVIACDQPSTGAAIPNSSG